MPLPSSDPFDDDDFFTNPETLNAISALEQQALAASQAPKKHGFHSKVAKPGGGPRAGGTPAAAGRAKLPPRINTEPVTRGCGMGWEPGGKHDVRLAKEQAAGIRSQEESPPDVVMNDQGQYRFGSADDDPIIDGRTRPEIRQLVEAGQRGNTRPRSAPAAASQARREAIFNALPSLPMKRSTSNNSAPGPSDPPKFAPRTLSRSVSTGSQSLGRERHASRPPPAGLPPIGSQGSQPIASQGAASRRAVFELEEERRLRQSTEAEMRALRARLKALEERGDSPPWAEERQKETVATVTELQQQLWAAQGQASTAKRVLETTESKLLAEIAKLKTGLSDAQTQMKAREHEAQQRIESMKTQAVFSNHAALASASKARQQSQRTASQRAAGQTPLKAASPLRDKSLFTPAPLAQSVQKKARPPPPRFDSLNNAFTATPNIGRKRQRTAVPSPQTTPQKSQKSLSQRGASQSPISTSPIQSQGRTHPPSDHEPDVSIDWQPDFLSVTENVRDPRTELVHHLLYHTTASTVDTSLQRPPQPTIVRLVSRKCDTRKTKGGQITWDALCGQLLRLCGDSTKPFHDFCNELMEVFADLFTRIAIGSDDPDDEDPHLLQIDYSWNNMLSTIDLLRLMSSVVLRFPSLPASSHLSAIWIAGGISSLGAHILPRSHDNWPKVHHLPIQNSAGHDLSEQFPPSDPDTGRASDYIEMYQRMQAELVNSIIEMGEAICLADGKCLWTSSELSILVYHITGSSVLENMLRGLDLFVAAACHHFRALLFHPGPDIQEFNGPRYPGETPVIDQIARFLLDGHKGITPTQRVQYTTILLAALFALSRANEDAVTLMTERSILVPALILLIHREASRLSGIQAMSTRQDNPLDIVAPAVTLLHHLVYPPPQAKPSGDDLSFGTPPKGVDIGRRIQEVSSMKDFNGIQHIFIATFGSLAFAEVDMDSAWPPPSGGLRTLAVLAQDLLDAVVEGPEGDSVYDIYHEKEEEGMEVEVEEDYGEEERLMGAEDWESD